MSVSPLYPLGMDFSICERVTPRLSHANSAVVLSAVKVLMKFMEMLSKDLDYYGTLLKKLAPPLVTLLSAEPELQYVALRNINLIVQKRYQDRRTHAVCAPGGSAAGNGALKGSWHVPMQGVSIAYTGSQPRTTLSSRGHLAVRAGGPTGVQWVEARDAA